VKPEQIRNTGTNREHTLQWKMPSYKSKLRDITYSGNTDLDNHNGNEYKEQTGMRKEN